MRRRRERRGRKGGRRGHPVAMVLVLMVHGAALVLVVRLGRLHLRLVLRCSWCLGTVGATPHLTSRSCSTTPFFLTTNFRRDFAWNGCTL